MAFSIAVASGKGGTGKTTVAVSLFNILASKAGRTVHLVDCDVEEPNDGLFFPAKQLINREQVHKTVPVIDTEKCTFCRRCADYCEFNAIVVIPTAGYAAVNNSLCHSCGACLVACEEDAISEVQDPIGDITNYDTGAGGTLAEGRLLIGSAMQTMLIRELKKRVQDQRTRAGETDAAINPGSHGKQQAFSIEIFDAPPGTSCPVVETFADTDYVVLVAEPTPFGLHDLKLTVVILQEMEKPFGVVVNKAGIGEREIYRYLAEEKIVLLGEIPYSRTFAQEYAKGTIHDRLPDGFREALEQIADGVMKYATP